LKEVGVRVPALSNESESARLIEGLLLLFPLVKMLMGKNYHKGDHPAERE
jgi:hypothetical protein